MTPRRPSAARSNSPGPESSSASPSVSLRTPDFFLVGAARSGTTSVADFLARHPDIFLPRLKEPKFFSFPDNRFPHRGPRDELVDRAVVADPRRYAELFAAAEDGQITGDASIDSLFFPGVASRIREANPAARILILLRNPVERAFSAFSYLRSTGRETLSFESALGAETRRKLDNWEFFWLYREVGLYYHQVLRYLEAFPRLQVLVLLFDELQRRPVVVGERILEFLGVAKVADSPVPTNISGDPRSQALLRLLHQPSTLSRLARWAVPGSLRRQVVRRVASLNTRPSRLPEPLRQLLQESYVEDILRTQSLIQQDLSSWLPS